MICAKPTLSIDKVCARYQYPAGEHGDAERNQLYEVKKSLLSNSLEEPGQVWVDGKNAMTYMTIQLKGGSKLLINYGYCSKRHWSWVRFNPSKMTETDYDSLRFFMGELYHYSSYTLWQHSDLGQLDVACDVQVEMEDFIFLDETLRIEYRHLETLYLGAQKGGRHLAIYDKRKERLEATGIDLGHDLLRIEARLLKPNKFAMADMQKVSNPFLPLQIIDRKKLQASNLPALHKFKSGLSYGPKPGSCLNYFSPGERKKFFSALPSVAPDWWKPKEIWNSYPEAFDWIHYLF